MKFYHLLWICAAIGQSQVSFMYIDRNGCRNSYSIEIESWDYWTPIELNVYSVCILYLSFYVFWLLFSQIVYANNQCSKEDVVDIATYISTFNPKVLGELVDVYGATINVIQKEIPLERAYAQCGGRCVNWIIKSLEVVLNEANTAVDRCRVNGALDNACMDHVYSNLSQKTQLVIMQAATCLQGVGITITQKQYELIAQVVVTAINKVIENEAMKWKIFPFQ